MEKDHDVPGAVPGFDDVLRLVHEYGGAATVPEDLLTEAGYYRSTNGTLAPIGYEVKGFMRTLEEKDLHKPFEPFDVEILSGAVPRKLTEPLLDRVRLIDFKIRQYFYDDAMKFRLRAKTPNHILQMPTCDFRDMMLRDTTDLAEFLVKNEVLHDMTGNHWTDSECLLRVSDFKSILKGFEFIRGDQRGYLDNNDQVVGEDQESDAPLYPIKATLWLSERAEQLRGELTDYDLLRRGYDDYSIQFDKPLEDNVVEFIWYGVKDYAPDMTQEEDDILYEKVTQYMDGLIARGIDTHGKLIMLMLGELLDNMFTGVRETSFADESLKLTTSEEVVIWLKHLEPELINKAKQDLKEAKKQLKLTPVGTPERTVAEDAIRKAKQAINGIKNNLSPVYEAFERPAFVARQVNKLLDEMQEILMPSGSEERTYTFVSDIDEEKDSVTSVVSGDCTDDLPLPFLEPNNDLYNVKVFRSGRHVGNIYLLQVSDKEGSPLIWHLDAIQIPQILEWDEAARDILKGFKSQAQQAGVKYITINGASYHISNYDYIARAFEKLTSSDRDIMPGSEISKLVEKAATATENLQVNRGDGTLLRLM